MSYTILNVAYPFTTVSPDASGGSEQILCTLDRLLTGNGHRSITIAVEGSRLKGELIPSPKATGLLTDEVRRAGRRVHSRLLLDALNRYSIDLVHMHSLDFHTYLPNSHVPTLATLHLPIDWYPADIFSNGRSNVFYNCVSASQQADCPACDRVVGYVKNGIDLETFAPKKSRESYVLALGRICPEKGFHLALEAARKAKAPMILAGELFPYEDHLKYFNQEIAPRLDRTRRYIGPVGAKEKRKLLAAASAVLIPSQVAETSSLVTMEALASGAPVIAFRSGAIPELVQHAQTGFLVSNVEEMAEAIRNRYAISPQCCRQSAVERCDHRSMGKGYLNLYSKLLTPTSQPFSRPRPMSLSWLTDLT